MEEEIKRLERESAEVQHQLEESDEESSECKRISVKFRILTLSTAPTESTIVEVEDNEADPDEAVVSRVTSDQVVKL